MNNFNINKKDSEESSVLLNLKNYTDFDELNLINNKIKQ